MLCGLLQQLYARLSELIGLNDHLLLLDFFVQKIATNLKCYTEVGFLMFGLLSLLFLEFSLFCISFIAIAEWRSYRPNLEPVPGAGIWVCLFAEM